LFALVGAAKSGAPIEAAVRHFEMIARAGIVTQVSARRIGGMHDGEAGKAVASPG
jgi:hypothetical protein